VWLGAARTLDAYRDRWGISHEGEPLGDAARFQHLSALPADRLADHIRTERDVAAARARLGWREPMTVERGLGR
jgi:hypothetical protein